MKNQKQVVALGFTNDGKTIVTCTPEVKKALEEIREGAFLNNAKERGESWTSKIKNIRVNLLKKTEKFMSI